MVNFIETVLKYPDFSRQFSCGNSLITAFNCPLEARLMQNRYSDLWSECNYIFYVIDGRKVWHTAGESYDLQKGKCVFVQKGASIIEQFFDTGFCLVLFFIPDAFICETLQLKSKPISPGHKKCQPVMLLEANETLETFFLSMSAYFASTQEPDGQLLELKFRELVLTLADNPQNAELLSYFCSLINEPQSLSMQRVMEDNYCFNLTLGHYAKLCNRSLSAFKRDFQKQYNTSPGKWLMEKRLGRAMHLLHHRNKNVGDAAFESGFQNTSHFSHAFKERYGITPNAARGKTRKPVNWLTS